MKRKTNISHAFCALIFATLIAGCTTSNVDESLGSASASRPAPISDVNDPNAVQVINNQNGTNPAADQTAANPQSLTQTQNPTAVQTATNQTIAGTEVQPAPLSGKKITFLPVTGAPQSAVTSLAKSLRAQADERRINLLPSNQPGADYQIKGYFSALDDGSGTLVVYVWDVLDPSGKRVHRISGNERSSKNSTNPWSAITDSELNEVTNTTMSRIESWLKRQT